MRPRPHSVREMLELIFSGASSDFAVDLGTANTLVYLKTKGIVVNEPSFVAVHDKGKDAGRVAAVGHRAKELVGRSSEKIRSETPVRGGTIHDFDQAQTLLRYVFSKLPSRSSLLKSRALFGVPSGTTEVERRAIVEAARMSGVGTIFLVEDSVLGAIGAGLPATEACGSMIVDIGAGRTTASVVSLGGVVRSESTKTAGNSLDRAIIEYLRRTRRAIVGEHTAEEIKRNLGAAKASGRSATLTVQGRDRDSGMPTSIELTEAEITEAIRPPLIEICRLIEHVLERTPPEIASDVVDRGLVLIGGGSLLWNVDLFIGEMTGVPVTLVEDPLTVTISGGGKVLEEWDRFKHIVQEVH